MRMERKSAPTPLRDYEQEAIQAAERRMAQAEKERVARLAQEARQEEEYFQRMQRLVIRDGKEPLQIGNGGIGRLTNGRN